MEAGPIGRGRERTLLLDWLVDAWGGASRVVLVAGEAGIGKTALVEALVAEVRRSATTIAVGRATEEAGAPPFWLWRPVLEAIGVPTLLDGSDRHDPPAERFGRFEAVAEAVAATARRAGTLLVVLDDVHRADEASLRLLVHVAGRLRDEPVAVVATHRHAPADHTAGATAALADLVRLPTVRRLNLRGLAPPDVASLLPDGTAAAVVTRIAEVTGGNPLFVGELGRHLADGGSPDDVPATVRDAVARRLGALPDGTAEVLRTASLSGRAPAVTVLAAAARVTPAEVLVATAQAVDAGLLERAADGGHRFVHALVGDAVRETIAAERLPVLHRAVATAVEAVLGAGPDHVADLARHWDASAVLGEPDVAAAWCERAAEAADRRLAWEEAARLWERASALAPPDTDPETRYRRLVGAARARLDGDEVTVAVERCAEAAAIAFGAGRVDLAAEAVLVPEWRGGPMVVALRRDAQRCLDELPVDAHAPRARLLGLLGVAAFYGEPDRCAALSVEAMVEAELADDPLAAAAAVRARQMATTNLEGAAERLLLADRIGAAGTALRRPGITLWDPVWRIDALLELGRLPEAAAALPELRRRAADVGLPLARWHVARLEAVIAQAGGRYADAVEAGLRAKELFALLEDPVGAEAIFLALLLTVRHHVGGPPRADEWLAVDGRGTPPAFLGDLGIIGPVVDLVDGGRLEEARKRYDRLAPPASSSPPPFLELALRTARLTAAIAVGRLDDVRPLVEQLLPWRGHHCVSSGGAVTHLGVVELHLGLGALALGQVEEAVVELRTALDLAASAGLRGFVVETATVLAECLVRLGDAGDEVPVLVSRHRPEAVALGMAPWLERLDALADRAEPSGPLSPRELEVAALVAAGDTNRAIATALFISERTAQNHVQHILTKLGVANRTQVATWFEARRTP